MKAIDLKIDELLEFRPQEGKFFLKGARSLIFNADAIGTLRKDLIHNLGYERAKGFLLRYGWQLGYNDGESLKDNFNWDSEEESLIAGSVLFTYKGFAKAENDVVTVDRDKKIFLKKGRFVNSFEAEQHLRIFGVSDHPVCWMLSGYASGYGSAFLGEKVYFLETKCEGKGDSVCEFEGRTLSDWGERIVPELPFYEDSSIKEELDNAYKRIQEQNKRLERSLTIHEELYQLVLRGECLSGITETISRISNGDILLFDTNLKLLAHTSGLNITATEEVKYVLKQHFAHILSPHIKPDIKSVNHLLPLEIPVYVNELKFNCFVLPIIAGDHILGFVSALYKGSSEILQESRILLQRAADIYAVEMMRQNQRFDIEHQFRADFIDSLFSQKYSNIESVVAWGERLGHNILAPHYVIAMEIDFDQTNIVSSERKLLKRKEIIEVTNKWLSEQYSSVICVEVKEKIVVLIPALTSKDYIRNIAQKMSERLSYLRCNISFGIGSMVTKVEDYYQSYVQACKALKVIKSFNKKDRILFYDDLGSMSLLLDVEVTTSLVEFMNQKLKPILDYDTKNNSDLLTTFEQYLSTENIHKAASVTNLSLSGLKYRLNKLKDFGYNLNSPDELFELQLAVRIYNIVK
ncbi:XylR N-terminal domain-containing protein [Desulfosporosinus fructosivorans]